MGYVLDFQEIDYTQVADVGGKGAVLGELSLIEGICVPAGFCVTTDAFARILAEAVSIDDRLDRLSRLEPEDGEAIRALSAEIRRAVEGIAIPDDVALAITHALARLGEQACAVRSSATAEDLPSASFAGQHDSHLNVVGPAAVLEHLGRCWASLFSERAVTYLLRNGFDHRQVQMAVVVQAMVFPEAAGILFTADPVTSSRKVASVEASFGLGEALISGLSHPQDIEWCLADDDFWIVQSRPITTLFPIPEAADRENHVYVSVGHGQMMTEAMRPLGVSVWQLTAMAPMHEAGGRLFVDVT